MSDPTTTAPAAPFKFSISAAVGDAETDALKVINKIHQSILDPKSTAADIYAAVQTLESYVKSVYTLYTVHKAETAPVLTAAAGLSGLLGAGATVGVLNSAAQAAPIAQASTSTVPGVGSTLLKDSGLAGLGSVAALAGGKLAGFSAVAKTDVLEVKQRIVSELETVIADAKAEYEKLKREVESELGGNAAVPVIPAIPTVPAETQTLPANG